MQLVAVPVSHVPDLNFVYGLLKLYDGETELSYPVQGLHTIEVHAVCNHHHTPSLSLFSLSSAHHHSAGVYINSQQKVSLFSTPYTTQRLQMEIHTSRIHGTATAISNSTDDSIILQRRHLGDGVDEQFSFTQKPFTAFPSVFEGVKTLQNTTQFEPSIVMGSNFDYVGHGHSMKNVMRDDVNNHVKDHRFRFGFDWSLLLNNMRPNLLKHDPLSNIEEQWGESLDRRRLSIDGDINLSTTALLVLDKTAAGGLKDQLDDINQLSIADSETVLTQPTEYGHLKIVVTDTRDSMRHNSTVGPTKLVFDFGYNLLPPKFQSFQKNTKDSSSTAQPTNCPYAFQLSVSPPSVEGIERAQLSNVENERLVQQMGIRSKLMEGSFKSDSCKKDIEVFISAYATQVWLRSFS